MGRSVESGFVHLRCDHCGDVIGVYEPLILRVQGDSWETSRIVDPQLPLPGAEHYHRACFSALHQARDT